MRQLKGPLFFVHVPKTCGTSLRLALERVFGHERVWKDYGKNSDDTSPAIQACIYDQGDFGRLGVELASNDIRMLVGHVATKKYFYLIDLENTISFVRDPAQRVISDYEHHVRHYGFTESLESFMRREPFRNRQFKMLRGFHPAMYGYIGLSEEYKASLEQLSRVLGMQVPYLEANIGRKKLSDRHEVETETLMLLEKYNRHDIHLYQTVQQLFAARKQAFEQDKEYVKGVLAGCTKQKVVGWAHYELSYERPVAVDVWLNGELLDQVEAKDYRPKLAAVGCARFGYVGFECDVKKLSKGDEVRCVASETQQELSNSPFIIE